MSARTKYWWRIDLYEPDEMTSDRTHGLPFRRIEFRGPGTAHVGTGKHRKTIQERLAKVGYRLMGTLERGSLKPRGEWDWRAAMWLAQQRPGKEIRGRVSQMERPFLIGPGPDEPVPKARGVNVIDWPRGRPKEPKGNPGRRRGRELTEEETHDARTRYAAGEDVADLAERYGVTQARVRTAVVGARPDRRRGPKGPGARGSAPLRPDQIETIVEAYRAGKKLSHIAAALRIDPNRVSGALAAAGIRPIRRHAQDPDEARAFVEAYAAGESTTAIAARMGVSSERVARVVRESGVEHFRPGGPPRTTTPEQDAAIVAAYQEGRPATEVGAMFEVERQMVIRVIKRAGVAPRPRRRYGGRTSRELSEEQVLAVAADYESGLTMAEVGERHGLSAHFVKRALESVGTRARATVSRGPGPALSQPPPRKPSRGR